MPMLTGSDVVDFARAMETLLLGFMSLIFTTDFYHGGISAEMKRNFNYPAWLVPIIGVVQLAVTALNANTLLSGANVHGWIAQRLVALLMGGCCFTHIRIAKKPKDASGALVFFIFSVLIPTLDGKEGLGYVVPAHLALAALGWYSAEFISRLEPRRQERKAAGAREGESKKSK